jgi:hypothetical protein
MEIVTLNLEFEIVFTANVYNSQQRGTREPPRPRLTASALAQAGEKLGVKLTGANELRHLELLSLANCSRTSDVHAISD